MAGLQKISLETVQNPRALADLLNAMFTQITSLTTLANELRTDHDTWRTAVGNVRTNLNNLRTVLTGDYLLSVPALSEGSTPANVATDALWYTVNGVLYYKAGVAAGTALSGDNIPQAKYGAWALDIGTNGTIDITEAADNSTGYDDAASSAAGLPAVAADHVRLGYVTASKSDGVFDPGTTGLNDASTTEAYTDGDNLVDSINAALSDDRPAALAAAAVTAQAEAPK